MRCPGPFGVNKTAKISSKLTKKPGKVEVSLSEPPRLVTTASAISGITTKTNAPKTTPRRLYTPVTTAPVKIRNERLNGNALGETALISITSKAPANPENAEEIANAITFNLPGFNPDNAAAV